jgi:hypothetical protein
VTVANAENVHLTYTRVVNVTNAVVVEVAVRAGVFAVDDAVIVGVVVAVQFWIHIVVTNAVAVGVGSARAIANTESVDLTDTWVNVVTNAVVVSVFDVTTANTVAVDTSCAVSFTVVVLFSKLARTVVHEGTAVVVASSCIGTTRASAVVTTTNATSVEHVAFAVTCAGRNVVAAAITNGAVATTNSTFVFYGRTATNTVAVHTSSAVAFTVVVLWSVIARAVVHEGVTVVVASRLVSTT